MSRTSGEGIVVQRKPKTSKIPSKYTHLSVHSLGIQSGRRGDSQQASESGEFTHGSSDLLDRIANERGLERGRGTELELRVEALSRKVAEAADALDAEQARLGKGERALGVFTAPEWFFKRPDVPFTEQDKHAVMDAVQKLSYQYPNLLIVPGSMVWGTIDTTIHNTTFAYLNGHLLRELDKRGDLGDTSTYQDQTGSTRSAKAAWQKGQTRTTKEMGEEPQGSSFFTAGGINFALEICGDHGRAQAEQRKNRKLPQHGVDVQILISHSAMPDARKQHVAPGGVLIHNDAVWGRRSVLQNEGAQAHLPQVATQELVGTRQGDPTGELTNLSVGQLKSLTARGHDKSGEVWLDSAIANVKQMHVEWDGVKRLLTGADELADFDSAMSIHARLKQALEAALGEKKLAKRLKAAARALERLLPEIGKLNAKFNAWVWSEVLTEHAAALRSLS